MKIETAKIEDAKEIDENRIIEKMKDEKNQFIVAKEGEKIIGVVRSSISLFLNLGFEIEGYFRDHFRKGTNIIQFAKFLS